VPRRRSPETRLELHLTPLIDLGFLLIVFFVLVARITSTERVPLTPPSPRDPLSEPPGDDPRLVLNILPVAEGAAFVLGGERFRDDLPGRAALRERLADLYRVNPDLRINLRADRAVRYDRIEPAMRTISAAAADASVGRREAIRPSVQVVVLRMAEAPGGGGG
jgi:biopolymer transport protein ExbD